MLFAGRLIRFMRTGLAIVLLILATSPTFTFAADTRTMASYSAPPAPPQNSFSLTEWTVPTPNATPWWITVDQSGKIWVTENASNKIARFDPSNNNFTEWAIPGSGRDPRFIFTKPVSVSGANQTRVYFTLYNSSKIAYFDSWDRTFGAWSIPSGSNPVGLYVDTNNTIWFTESGRDKIAKLNPNNNQLIEWSLPGATVTPGTPLLRPWGIYVQNTNTGPFSNITDRYVWFTEVKNNAVARFQATNNQLTTWNLNSLNIIPGLQYGPMGITLDSSIPGINNIIFTSSLADRISVLTNAGIAYREYTLPSHVSVAKLTSLSLDRTRGLTWFTEYNTGIIGAANTTSPAISSIPPTSSTSTLTPTLTPSSLTLSVNATGGSVIQYPVTETVASGTSTQAVTEYSLPNSTSRPNSVIVDATGNVWFTESNRAVNRIGRLSIPYVFQLSASPTAQSTIQGGSAAYTISVGVVSGNPLPVQLSLHNVPSNVSVDLSPPIGTPPFSSVLTVSTSNNTTPNTYSMSVVAASGSISQTSTVTLTVQALPPPASFDYRVDVTGASTVTVQQGSIALFTVGVSLTSGTTQPVNLSVSGLPPMSAYSLSTTNGQPPFSSTLSIQTSADTPGGSYPIIITGLSDGGSPHHPSQIPLLLITEIPRDFNLTTVSSVTLVQGSRIYVPVTITSLNYFSSNVTLSGSFSASVSGLAVSFSPPVVAPAINGTAQSIMEITAFQNTAGHPYQLTVTGTSDMPARTHQVTLSVSVSPCLIATASYGSSTAPEVQFLRSFRDDQILHTFAGSAFMKVFNSWYYSFSPNVAQFEYSHSTMRSMIRTLLYPLVAILHLGAFTYSTLAAEPESAVLATGLLASFLVGLAYGSLPVCGLLYILRRRFTAKISRNMQSGLAGFLVLSLGLFAVSEIFLSPWVMMVAAVSIVLSATALGTVSPAIWLFKRFRRQSCS